MPENGPKPPPRGRIRPRLQPTHPVWTRLRPPDRPPAWLPRESRTRSVCPPYAGKRPCRGGPPFRPGNIVPTPFHSTRWRCRTGSWGGAKSAGKQPQTASTRPNSAQLHQVYSIWSRLRPAGRRPNQHRLGGRKALRMPTVRRKAAVRRPNILCPLHSTPSDGSTRGQLGRDKKYRKTAQNRLHTARVGHGDNRSAQHGADCVRPTDPWHSRPGEQKALCALHNVFGDGRAAQGSRLGPEILRPLHSTPRHGDARGPVGAGPKTAENGEIRPPRGQIRPRLQQSHPVWSRLPPAGRPPNQTIHRRTEARCTCTVCQKTAVLWTGSRLRAQNIAPTPPHSTRWTCSRGTRGGAKSAGKQRKSASRYPGSATATTVTPNMEQIASGRQAVWHSRPGEQKTLCALHNVFGDGRAAARLPLSSQKYCAHTIPLHRMETPDGQLGRAEKCRKTA